MRGPRIGPKQVHNTHNTLHPSRSSHSLSLAFTLTSSFSSKSWWYRLVERAFSDTNTRRGRDSPLDTFTRGNSPTHASERTMQRKLRGGHGEGMVGVLAGSGSLLKRGSKLARKAKRRGSPCANAVFDDSRTQARPHAGARIAGHSMSRQTCNCARSAGGSQCVCSCLNERALRQFRRGTSLHGPMSSPLTRRCSAHIRSRNGEHRERGASGSTLPVWGACWRGGCTRRNPSHLSCRVYGSRVVIAGTTFDISTSH